MPNKIGDLPDNISDEARAFYAGLDPVSIDVDLCDPQVAQTMRDAIHAEWRATNEEIKTPFEFRPENMGGVPGVWITSGLEAPGNYIVMALHGGAYVFGNPEDNASTAIAVANQTGRPIFSVDYRLAPEHPFPAAIDDAVAAYSGLLQAGFSPAQIGVLGESAGAGLALAMSLRLREMNLALPGALVLLSAWADLEGKSDSLSTLQHADLDFAAPSALFSCVAPYVRAASVSDPLISPVNATLDGFPPLFIQAGAREMLLSDSLRLAHNARESHVDVTLDIWDGMGHVFNAIPGLPEADAANKRIAEFLVSKLC